MPILSTHNLCFSYGKKILLENISLNFNKGEFVGLIGQNGIGKSTLLELLLGFIKPNSGEVFLNEESIFLQKRKEIAKEISFVPQSIELPYQFSVMEIVSMGRNPYLGAFEFPTKLDFKYVLEALEKTDLIDLKERYVDTLSGGEKQRVMIARALAQKSNSILLDEPISSLDLSHQVETLELIQKLTRSGKLAITAIHDLNMASLYCDRLILIGNSNNGSGNTIIADGSPIDVLTAKNLAEQFGISANITFNNEKLNLSEIRSIKR